MTRIIIIGGGAAGPKTAAKLRRENSDFQIDMYTDENIVSYSACGLPYYIEGIIPNIEELLVRSPAQFAKSGINVYLNKKCIKINKEKQSVILEDMRTGGEQEEYYDILVLATGARPYIPNIKNIETGNVFYLRKLIDGVKIKEAMSWAKTVTLIGFGYIGMEIAEAFIKNGLHVNVIESKQYIMNNFDEEISEIIRQKVLSRGNINIYTSDIATKFISENGNIKKVVTLNGNSIDTDFAVICAGVLPNSELASEAGLKIGVRNSIWVNSHMKTSYPTIYAAGDCCEKQHLMTFKPCWLPLGSTANKEGRCAALNIANKKCEFEGVSGTVVSRYFDFTVCMTGISEKEAWETGFKPVSATVTKSDKVGYMPDSAEITLKVTVDSVSRKILGAQAVGQGDAEKRIAEVSVAISTGITSDDFLKVDLPYAPPYAPTIDPLLNAFLIIRDKIDNG